MAFKMSGVLSRSYACGLRLSLSLQDGTRAVTGPRNGFRFGLGTGLPQIRKAIRFRERATPLTPASGVGARIINQPPFSCKTVYNNHHRSTARVFNSPFAVFNNAVRVPAPLIFGSSSARRVVFWAGVLGLTVLGGTAASLHRSAVVAMAPKLTPVDLDSPASDWKEAKRDVCVSLCLSQCFSVSQSFSVCVSLCLSVSLSVSLSLSLCFFSALCLVFSLEDTCQALASASAICPDALDRSRAQRC
ncbi:hypothetical protein HHUSO_G21192 [Huso huso]|uniref:Transmembrane protein n=1 Tax=Huso huso TaxID=61971 RepID=A0ABR0YZM0_HUSHU